jgi:hypothetical protein
VLHWTRRFLSGDLTLTTRLVHTHMQANPARFVRATVVSTTSQVELEKLHVVVSNLQEQTRRADSAVVDQRGLTIGLESKIRSIEPAANITAPVIMRNWPVLTTRKSDVENAQMKLQVAKRQVEVLEVKHECLGSEVSAAQDHVNEMHHNNIQSQLALGQVQTELERARYWSGVAIQPEAGTAAASVDGEVEPNLVAAWAEAEARWVVTGRLLNARCELATANLAEKRREAADSETALVSARRALASQRALVQKAVADFGVVVDYGVVLPIAAVAAVAPVVSTTYSSTPSSVPEAVGDDYAAMDGYVPVNASWTSNPNLLLRFRSLSITMAMDIVLASDACCRNGSGYSGPLSRASRAILDVHVDNIRTAIREVMHTTAALAEACVSTCVAVNYRHLNVVIALLIKARLPQPYVLSTPSSPMQHALFYANRFNVYMNPRGHRGSSLPHDFGLYQPEFVQTDIQLSELSEIDVGVDRSSAVLRGIMLRLDYINLSNSPDAPDAPDASDASDPPDAPEVG